MSTGQRINFARVALNLDLDALSAQVNIDSSDLAAYEADRHAPSQAVLNLLGKALSQTKLYLSRQSDLPELVSVSPRIERLDERTVDVLFAQASLWLERYLDLDALGRLGQTGIWNPPDDFPVTASTPAEASAIAEELRQEWQLEDRTIDNLIELLESKGIVIALVNVAHNFDACALRTADSFGIPVIAVQQGHSAYAQRFAIARELAHLVLDELTEALAAHFAGAMLMCETNICNRLGTQRDELYADEIAKSAAAFGVAPQHVLSRAGALHIINKEHTNQWMEAGRSQGWQAVFGDVAQPEAEQPQLMTAMANELIRRDERAAGVINEMLIIPWLS